MSIGILASFQASRPETKFTQKDGTKVILTQSGGTSLASFVFPKHQEQGQARVFAVDQSSKQKALVRKNFVRETKAWLSNWRQTEDQTKDGVLYLTVTGVARKAPSKGMRVTVSLFLGSFGTEIAMMHPKGKDLSPEQRKVIAKFRALAASRKS